MKIFVQSLILICSFSLVYFWQTSFLSIYTIPALGFLIFLYLLVSAKKKSFSFQSNILGIFILNTIILLLIFATGNLNSSIFFLLYFISFGIAFVFEPAVIFVFTLGVVAIFLPEALQNQVMDNLIKLGSLALISPLAYFFGREYRERDKDEEKIEEVKERAAYSGEKIKKDVEKVLEKEKNKLDSEDINKLNEAVEEAEDLKMEAKEH